MKFHVYFGTYTNDQSKGIYRAALDATTGDLSEPCLAAETPNPSFFVLHPTGDYFFAAGEVNEYQGQKGGTISAFAVDRASGALRALNVRSTRGEGACHVSTDAAGHWLFVANYVGASVAAAPIHPDGSLGELTAFIRHEGSSVNPDRQGEAHAHSINIDPTGRYVFAADLGTDQLMAFRFDPRTGSLTPHDPPFVPLAPGAGPRHFTFDLSGRYCFVLNELQSTITTFGYDASNGTMQALQTISTIPKDFNELNYTAEIVLHPNGRCLYASNRGHDSVALFHIDATTGKLVAGHRTHTGGTWPRNFRIDPTGHWLIAANHTSDNITVFRLDQSTGELSPTGGELRLQSPVCVKFLAES